MNAGLKSPRRWRAVVLSRSAGAIALTLFALLPLTGVRAGERRGTSLAIDPGPRPGPAGRRATENDVRDLTLRAPDGHVFPLGRVATLKTVVGQPEITRDVTLVWRHQRHLSPAPRAFLELARTAGPTGAPAQER